MTAPTRTRQFANALADLAAEHALAARHDCLMRDYAALMADFDRAGVPSRRVSGSVGR